MTVLGVDVGTTGCKVVAVEAQRADGARWSLVPLVTQCVGTCLVFGLSVRLGSGGLSRADLALAVRRGKVVMSPFAPSWPPAASDFAMNNPGAGVTETITLLRSGLLLAFEENCPRAPHSTCNACR